VEPNGRQALRGQVERFHRLVAELESVVDSGFFVSLAGRVVVDEKRLLGILNQMRMIDFNATIEALEEEARGAAEHRYPAPPRKPPETADEMLKQAYEDAEVVRRGADEYARQVLDNLEEKLESTLASIREGQKVLQDRTAEKPESG